MAPTGRLSSVTASEADTLLGASDSPHTADYPMRDASAGGLQGVTYAILRDDVMDEAALLSTSEDYFAERESSYLPSRHSSYAGADSSDDDGLDAARHHYDYERNITSNYGAILQEREDAVASLKSDDSISMLIDEARTKNKLINWYKRPSVLMISFVMFLYAFSAGVGATSELKLLIVAVCWIHDGAAGNCNSPLVQQSAANLQKWNSTITGLIKILVSAKISALSDVYGRRPMLLYTFMMSVISKLGLVFVFTPRFYSNVAYVLTMSIDAIGGSIFVFLALSNSYVVDVVDDSDRLHSLGKVVAGLFLGMSMGPLLSSFLSLSSPTLLKLSTLLTFLSFVAVIVFLPESRSSKLRSRSHRESNAALHLSMLRQANEIKWYEKIGLAHLVESLFALKLFWITRKNPSNGKLDISARLNVIYMMIIDMLIGSCQIGAAPALVLYGIYYYNWDQHKLGLIMGLAAGLRALILSFFNPWFHSKLKKMFVYHSTSVDFIDIVTISTALLLLSFGSLFASIYTREVGLLVYIVATSFVGLVSPTIHSAVLKYNEEPGNNGAWFGGMALIRNLVNLVSPLVFLSLYVLSFSTWRPLIFGTIALFSFISIFLICSMRIE